jgi:hypothetical protein
MRLSQTSYASSVISLLVLLYCSPVGAEIITDPAKAIEAIKANKGGAWLDADALKKCLDCEVMKKSQAEELEIDNQERAAYKNQLDALLTLKNIQAEKIELLTKKDADRDVYEKAQEGQLKKWYRNPFVVGTLGLIIGAVITGTAYTVIMIKTH